MEGRVRCMSGDSGLWSDSSRNHNLDISLAPVHINEPTKTQQLPQQLVSKEKQYDPTADKGVVRNTFGGCWLKSS